MTDENVNQHSTQMSISPSSSNLFGFVVFCSFALSLALNRDQLIVVDV